MLQDAEAEQREAQAAAKAAARRAAVEAAAARREEESQKRHQFMHETNKVRHNSNLCYQNPAILPPLQCYSHTTGVISCRNQSGEVQPDLMPTVKHICVQMCKATVELEEQHM